MIGTASLDAIKFMEQSLDTKRAMAADAETVRQEAMLGPDMFATRTEEQAEGYQMRALHKKSNKEPQGRPSRGKRPEEQQWVSGTRDLRYRPMNGSDSDEPLKPLYGNSPTQLQAREKISHELKELNREQSSKKEIGQLLGGLEKRASDAKAAQNRIMHELNKDSSRKIGEFARSHGLEQDESLYEKVYQKNITAKKRDALKSKLASKPSAEMTHDERVRAMRQRAQE